MVHISAAVKRQPLFFFNPACNSSYNNYGEIYLEIFLRKRLVMCYELQGECCVASSRVFVQEGIYDKFVEKAAEKARNRVVGDPFQSGVEQGPQARNLSLLGFLHLLDNTVKIRYSETINAFRS
mgnify:CR=1 FL=1